MNAVQVVARGRAEFVTCCSLSSAKPLISVEFGSKTTAFTLPESLVFSSAPNCPAAFDSQTAQILVTRSAYLFKTSVALLSAASGAVPAY